MSDYAIEEGLPYPLGATWSGKGTNFAVFSANATKVEVCIFDGDRETHDRMRPLRGGQGTFDRIIDNVFIGRDDPEHRPPQAPQRGSKSSDRSFA